MKDVQKWSENDERTEDRLKADICVAADSSSCRQCNKLLRVIRIGADGIRTDGGKCNIWRTA